LPEPLNRPAPFALRHRSDGKDSWFINYHLPEMPIAAAIQREKRGKSWQLSRATVNFGASKAALPLERRVNVNGNIAAIDLSQWLNLLNTTSATPDTGMLGNVPVSINLAAQEVTLTDFQLHNIKIAAQTSATGSELCRMSLGNCWRVDLDGAEIAGTFEWENAVASRTPNGRFQAALSRLTLPKNISDISAERQSKVVESSTVMTWPQIAIDAQNLQISNRQLGHLKFEGRPLDNEWRITNLTLDNDDGHLALSGWWRVEGGGALTNVAVAARTANLQNFLARFNIPDGLVAKDARLNGSLQWHSVPSDFDLETLNGSLEVHVGAGRFTKIEPGLGRLLGVLSLQALPRRIILDFRDVFTEGFAFDDINGATTITNGIMNTQSFILDGPAAKVRIMGDINLIDETQDLLVNVRPSISDGLSVGAAGATLAMSTPVGAAAVGLGAIVGQLILDDPLGKIFSYEYTVNGSWTDPIVAKKTAPRPPLTEPYEP
jgi:uncharacterized protein YhdP